MSHSVRADPPEDDVARGSDSSSASRAMGSDRFPRPSRGLRAGVRGRVSRLPLRLRLVAGFLAAMLVLLTAAGAFVYWRVEYALDRGLDTELNQATTTITPLVDKTGHVASPDPADATGTSWQVLDGTGAITDSGGPVPATPMVTARDLERVGTGTLTKDIGDFLPAVDEPYRVHLTALEPTSGASGANQSARVYLLVGVRRDHRDEALRELLLQLAVAGLGALVIAAVVGDLLARAALRPVERFRRRAQDIAGGANGLRLEVPVGRDDEVTRLGHTLNEMLAALERSLDHERRFVNDASHELRTPLTLLKSRIQLARRRPRNAEEHERILDELAVDVARLADLAEQLLALGSAAQGTEGAAEVNRVVSAVVERRRLARPDQAHQITLELATPSAHALIEPLALERIVTNLVENAFTHGEPPVHVRVARAPSAPALTRNNSPLPATGQDWIVVQVEDSGPGMPPDLLAQATDRFTRSPEARTRPGAGLGLSLVEQSVTAAGGEVRLCYQGVHTHHGRPVPAPCNHEQSMTVSVILPSTPG
jgi:signal transduction histidine kinase